MKKILFALLMIAGLACPLVSADEVVLTNGKIVEGNITNIDKDKGKLTIDVVLSGQLVGMIMTLDKSEIQGMKQDGKYARLQRANSPPQEGQKANIKAMSASPSAKTSKDDINARIRQRAAEEIARTNPASKTKPSASSPAATATPPPSKDSGTAYVTHPPPMESMPGSAYSKSY